MKKIAWILSPAAVVAAAVAGCAALASGGGAASASLDRETQHMLLTGFHNPGIATMDRITGIDDTLKACNAADVAGKPLDEATA